MCIRDSAKAVLYGRDVRQEFPEEVLAEAHAYDNALIDPAEAARSEVPKRSATAQRWSIWLSLLHILRMSGEQKLKDGDEVVYTKETTNSAELLFFTNHAQVYKSLSLIHIFTLWK